MGKEIYEKGGISEECILKSIKLRYYIPRYEFYVQVYFVCHMAKDWAYLGSIARYILIVFHFLEHSTSV